MQLPRLPAPALGLMIAAAVILEIAGLSHAFRVHGRKDGTIALVLPPYAFYRAVESLGHTTLQDPSIMAESDDGRRELSAEVTLPEAEWQRIIAELEERKTHSRSFVMREAGTAYSATAEVVPGGAAVLTSKGPKKDDAEMKMTDEDRDQTPETLTITKTVDGKREPVTFPLAAFQNGEESQFLLAWSIAWAQLARE